MNRLPKVLQTEIWEYVRGNRTFWRQQFRQCITEIGQPIRNIRHSFGKKSAFFETLDLDSYPLFPPEDTDDLTTYMNRQRMRLIRGTLNAEFWNGKLIRPWHGDILDGIIFPGHVPEAVYFDFGAGAIRLQPVGNRLKFPWLPNKGSFSVRDPIRNFPCQLTFCKLRIDDNNFLREVPFVTTFSIGHEKFSIGIFGGHCVIAHGTVKLGHQENWDKNDMNAFFAKFRPKNRH